MLNPYKIVWLFVMFDIPTGSKAQRKKLYDFRKGLLRDGFRMEQYSVYTRFCVDRANAETHLRRIRALVPDIGRVKVLSVTDRQYGDMVNFFSGREIAEKGRKTVKELEIF